MPVNYLPIRAVLFDLDDTLSDHQYSRRCGLEMLRSKYEPLKKVPIEVLENEHEKILQGNYHHTLDGKLSMEEAMAARIHQLCRLFDVNITSEEAIASMIEYRHAYEQNRRAVPGALNLLKYLSPRVTVGVVTNGLEAMQREKLSGLGLEPYVAFVLASETIGIRKPDPGIFLTAMRLAGSLPENTIFIGDSWSADIIGARQCGLKSIWLNRYGHPSPDPTLTREINSFEPWETTLKLILAR